MNEIDKIKVRDARDHEIAMSQGREIPRQNPSKRVKRPQSHNRKCRDKSDHQRQPGQQTISFIDRVSCFP